jgi:hypothetical protein
MAPFEARRHDIPQFNDGGAYSCRSQIPCRPDHHGCVAILQFSHYVGHRYISGLQELLLKKDLRKKLPLKPDNCQIERKM